MALGHWLRRGGGAANSLRGHARVCPILGGYRPWPPPGGAVPPPVPWCAAHLSGEGACTVTDPLARPGPGR
eukprot:2317499-Prymnesium_polylepis.1